MTLIGPSGRPLTAPEPGIAQLAESHVAVLADGSIGLAFGLKDGRRLGFVMSAKQAGKIWLDLHHACAAAAKAQDAVNTLREKMAGKGGLEPPTG